MMPEPQEDGYEALEEWVLGTESALTKPKSKFSPVKLAQKVGTKVAEKVGLKEKPTKTRPNEPSYTESSEGPAPLDGPTQEELRQRESDRKGIGLETKTNQERYGKFLVKGEKPDLNVPLEQETPEKDSRGNTNLQGDDADDRSEVPWPIYTIVIPAEKLNSWAMGGFKKDLVLPISITLQAAIYKRLIKDANWVKQITGLAEEEATSFISVVREVIKAGGSASEEDLMKGLQLCTAKLKTKIEAIIESYKQTKEELRKYQGKVGVAVGLDAAKITFHIGHSVATLGATAPVGFVLAFKNTTDLLQECAKITSNPGTVAVEIDAGFKALQKEKKQGTVGRNLMQVVTSGVSLLGNKTLPLNFEALKKKIEKDHRMAIASLVTAQHRIGKLLAMDVDLEELYHTEIETVEEAKLNKVKRMFPQFLSKQRATLQELSNSYESRIAKHTQLNRYFLEKLDTLKDDNWEYSKDIGDLGEKVESNYDVYEVLSAGLEILGLVG
jgi:hypothetical protein